MYPQSPCIYINYNTKKKLAETKIILKCKYKNYRIGIYTFTKSDVQFNSTEKSNQIFKFYNSKSIPSHNHIYDNIKSNYYYIFKHTNNNCNLLK